MKRNENRTSTPPDDGFMRHLAGRFAPILYGRVSTHQPALPASRSCFGQWPGSTAACRCSSRSPVCPRSGRSCSWPGPRTRSHLRSSRGSVQRTRPAGRSGVTLPHPPMIVARTHFFLLVSGIHGGLQLHKKEPSVLTQWPLAHRDSSWHSFTSEGAARRRVESSIDILKRGLGLFGTHQCTPAGCCRSRSPFRSSTRSLAACSRSDPSYRFPPRTKSTRRCLQTKKEPCAQGNEETLPAPCVQMLVTVRYMYLYDVFMFPNDSLHHVLLS